MGLLGLAPGALAAGAGRLEVKPARYATEIAPGDSTATQLKLTNRTTLPVPLDLEVILLEAGDRGSFAQPSRDAGARSATSWLQVPRDSLTLQAGASITLPVRISVPADATPGAYAVAVVASQRRAGLGASSNGIGTRVDLEADVGSTFVVVVSGAARAEARILRHRSPRVVWGGDTPRFTASVENAGNTLLELESAVELSPFGAVAGRRLRSEELPTLPGGRRELVMRWTDRPWFGWFRPELVVVGGAGSGVREEVELPTVFVVPPWWLLLATAIAAGVPVVGWLRRRRMGQAVGETEHEAWEPDDLP